MILMAGDEPYAHVLSEFPPKIPFIRIQSNFTSPEADTGFNTLIRDRIKNHNGPYKLLIPQIQFLRGVEALHYFDLTLSLQSCQSVRDTLTETSLDLCDVQPTHKLAVTP